LTQEDVAANLGDRLARFKLPKRLLFVDQLPRNSMGKVQKSALRQEYAGLYRV
jgi:malonyl-CoA/methylmalonyl-CoA synthetase